LLDIFRDAIESWVVLTDQCAAGMVHKSAELQRANVVDPFRGRARIGDHIFTADVEEL
jgi:hypothetical protein